MPAPSLDEILTLANQQLADNNYDAAIKTVNKADVVNSDLLTLYAKASFGLANFGTAIEYATYALTYAEKDDAGIRLLIAQSYWELSNRLITAEPDNSEFKTLEINKLLIDTYFSAMSVLKMDEENAAANAIMLNVEQEIEIDTIPQMALDIAKDGIEDGDYTSVVFYAESILIIRPEHEEATQLLNIANTKLNEIHNHQDNAPKTPVHLNSPLKANKTNLVTAPNQTPSTQNEAGGKVSTTQSVRYRRTLQAMADSQLLLNKLREQEVPKIQVDDLAFDEYCQLGNESFNDHQLNTAIAYAYKAHEIDSESAVPFEILADSYFMQSCYEQDIEKKHALIVDSFITANMALSRDPNSETAKLAKIEIFKTIDAQTLTQSAFSLAKKSYEENDLDDFYYFISAVLSLDKTHHETLQIMLAINTERKIRSGTNALLYDAPVENELSICSPLRPKHHSPQATPTKASKKEIVKFHVVIEAPGNTSNSPVKGPNKSNTSNDHDESDDVTRAIEQISRLPSVDIPISKEAYPLFKNVFELVINKHIASNAFKLAYKFADKFVKCAPRSADARLLRAKAMFAYAKSETENNDVTPPLINAYIDVTTVRAWDINHSEANELRTKILSAIDFKNPSTVSIFEETIEKISKDSNDVRVIMLSELLLEHHKTNKKVIKLLGNTHLALENFDEAITLALNALASPEIEDKKSIYTMLISAYYRKGDYLSALMYFEEAQNNHSITFPSKFASNVNERPELKHLVQLKTVVTKIENNKSDYKKIALPVNGLLTSLYIELAQQGEAIRAASLQEKTEPDYSSLENCTAAQIARKTATFLNNLRDTTNHLTEMKIITDYENELKRIPGWQRFAKVLIAVVFGLVGFVTGAAIGCGAGLLMGSFTGPGAIVTAALGLAHGAISGATAGVLIAGAITAVGASVSATGMWSKFMKSTINPLNKQELVMVAGVRAEMNALRAKK